MSSINRMMTHTLLTPDECAAIRAGLTEEQWSDGLVGFGDTKAPRVDYALRQCDIAEVTDDALKKRVAQAISTVNAHVFNLDVMGFSPEDPALDLLLGKQFLASAQLPAALAGTPKLQTEITKRFRALQPWIDWLNDAVKKG